MTEYTRIEASNAGERSQSLACIFSEERRLGSQPQSLSVCTSPVEQQRGVMDRVVDAEDREALRQSGTCPNEALSGLGIEDSVFCVPESVSEEPAKSLGLLSPHSHSGPHHGIPRAGRRGGTEKTVLFLMIIAKDFAKKPLKSNSEL